MSESNAVGKFKVGDFVKVTYLGEQFKGVVHTIDFDFEYPYEVYVVHMFSQECSGFALFKEEELDALD